MFNSTFNFIAIFLMQVILILSTYTGGVLQKQCRKNDKHTEINSDIQKLDLVVFQVDHYEQATKTIIKQYNKHVTAN